MNRYRQRHADHKAAEKSPSNDSGSVDAELTDAADDVYAEASKHRAGVISKDLAAKVRRKKSRG